MYRLRRSMTSAAVMLTTALSFSSDRPLVENPANFSCEQAKAGAQNRIANWPKTHLIVVNGDSESRHKRNALVAANVGIKNNAAAVYLAGLSDEEGKGIQRYKADVSGVEKILSKVKKDSTAGDTVFMYITGHGDQNAFILEDGEKLPYEKLLASMERNLGERKIIFVSDACMSADFVDLVTDSGAFPDITAMSPGLKNEKTSCSYFAEPFWHAINSNLDLDGNGDATLVEAFYYGLKGYRQLNPDTLGTYRQSIPEVKSIESVENGIVMVTADWCGACKKMEPIFNTTNLLLQDSVSFYLVDAEKIDFKGSLPTIIIRKNGKDIAQHRGTMSLIEFSNWLKENGTEVRDVKIPVRNLYCQGRYESIILAFDWKEISAEIGERKALDLITSFLKHKDPNIRRNAVFSLGIPAERGLNYHNSVKSLIEALKDEDKLVRLEAVGSLRLAAKNRRWEEVKDIAIPGLIRVLADPENTVRSEASEALYSMGRVSRPFILEALEGGKALVKLGAVKVLNSKNNPKALSIVIAEFENEDVSIRNQALNRISEFDSDLVFSHMVRALDRKNGEITRSYAAYVLGELKDPRAVPHLIKALNSDDYWNVRFNAAEGLRKIRDKSALPALRSAAANEEEITVKRAINDAIAEIRG